MKDQLTVRVPLLSFHRRARRDVLHDLALSSHDVLRALVLQV